MQPQHLAGDTKLGRVADAPEGHTAIPRDLDRLEKWTTGASPAAARGSAKSACGKGQPQAALDEARPAAQGGPSPLLSTDVVLKYRFQVVLGSPAPQRRGSTERPKQDY